MLGLLSLYAFATVSAPFALLLPRTPDFYFVNVRKTFSPSRTNVYELFAFASITEECREIRTFYV